MTYLGRKSSRASGARKLAVGLGWFSIGLGLGELLGARTLTRVLGMEGREKLLRAYGLREIGVGVGVLASARRGPWVWGRAAGDVLDIATLAPGLSAHNPKQRNVGLALATVLGVTVLDVLCSRALSAAREANYRQLPRPRPDYSKRSGFPREPRDMWGAARDFEVPRDMRTPEPLRPYTLH